MSKLMICENCDNIVIKGENCGCGSSDYREDRTIIYCESYMDIKRYEPKYLNKETQKKPSLSVKPTLKSRRVIYV